MASQPLPQHGAPVGGGRAVFHRSAWVTGEPGLRWAGSQWAWVTVGLDHSAAGSQESPVTDGLIPCWMFHSQAGAELQPVLRPEPAFPCHTVLSFHAWLSEEGTSLETGLGLWPGKPLWRGPGSTASAISWQIQCPRFLSLTPGDSPWAKTINKSHRLTHETKPI